MICEKVNDAKQIFIIITCFASFTCGSHRDWKTEKPGKWGGIFQSGKSQGILSRLEKSGKSKGILPKILEKVTENYTDKLKKKILQKSGKFVKQ